MKWKCLKNNYKLIIFIILFLTYIIIDKGFIRINNNSPVEEICDTTYNYIIIDSLIYNIEYRDSIIYEITYEYENKIIEADNLCDSSAIELFKELCTNDSLYGRNNNI